MKSCLCRNNYSWDGFECNYDPFPNITTTSTTAIEQDNTVLIVVCSFFGFLIISFFGLIFTVKIARCITVGRVDRRLININLYSFSLVMLQQNICFPENNLRSITARVHVAASAPEPPPNLVNNNQQDILKQKADTTLELPPSYEQVMGRVS
jgi:hypothetical protein